MISTRTIVRLIFASLFLLTFTTTAVSQNTAYLKVANNGSFAKIERVNSGGYITVGYDSAYAIQVVRYDASFTPTWKVKFTDANIAPIAPQVVEANDGNFYFMTASNENTGSTLIVKISASGSVLWQKKYYVATGNLNSQALSRAAGSDNGFIIGGGQCTLTNYLIKCDQDGLIEWQHQYLYPLSSGVTTCWSIIPEGNNYTISCGYNINSLLTIKLDGSGNVTSHSAYTYTGMQIIPTRIVKLVQSGGYAIFGNYNSSNDNKTEFVAFYDQNLSLLSFNELTVTYTQFTLWDMAPVSNGKNVVLAGGIYDGSDFTMALINVSATGSVVWKKRSAGNVGSITNVEFRGITTNGNYTINAGHGYNEGRVIAVIDSNGNGLCNDVAFSMTNVHRTLTLQSSVVSSAAATAVGASVSYTYTNQASHTKYIYCGSLSSVDELLVTENSEINIFPNPASDKFQIEVQSSPTGNDRQICIFDHVGRMVFSKDLSPLENTIEVDARALQSGVYLIRITNGASILGCEKVMISR